MKKKIKIAIVDDNTINRKALTRCLNRTPEMAVIIEVETNSELLQQLETKIPDVVMLILDFPELDIFNTIQAIREKFPEIKIIVFTLNNSDDYIITLIEKGINSIIYKKDDLEKLLFVINTVMKNDFAFSIQTIQLVAKHITGINSMKRNPRKQQLDSIDYKIIKLTSPKMTAKEIGEKVFLSEGAVNKRRIKISEILCIEPGPMALMEYAIKHQLR